MPRHPAPTSAFGKLRLGESPGPEMPVTTRAQAQAAQQQQRNLRSSQAASSRPAAGPSRRQGMASSGRRSGRYDAPASSEGANGSDPGGGTDDEDESSEEDEAGAAERRRQEVGRLMTVFDPYAQLSPHEFLRVNANSDASSIRTHTLSNAIAQLVRTDEDVRRLQRAASFGTGWWADRLAANMERRYRIIYAGLYPQPNQPAHVRSSVRETITNLQVFFGAVATIGRDYFPAMQATERQRFVELLVSGLEWIVSENRDLSTGTAQPAYAGEGFQSETRLFSAFTAERTRPIQILGYFTSFSGQHLRRVAARLEAAYQTAAQTMAPALQANNPDSARLRQVLAAIRQVAQHARHGA